MDRLEPPELARQARQRADTFTANRGATSNARMPAIPDIVAKARARTMNLHPQATTGEVRRPIDPR